MTARLRVKETPGRRARKEERLRALAESALRARRFSAGDTLALGFELIESGRSLNRAVKKADARRGA